MKDPELEPLSLEAFALLTAERLREPDGLERTERLLARVKHTLALPPAGGAGGGGPTAGSGGAGATSTLPPPPPVGAVATTASYKVGGALFAAFLAGGITGAFLHAYSVPAPRLAGAPAVVAPASRPAVSAVPRTAEAETIPTVAVDTLPPAPSPSAQVRAPSSSSPVGASTGAGALAATPKTLHDFDLAKEQGILDTARAALARGSVGAALDALREHERDFPSGRLREERDAMLVQVLASTGQDDEVRRRARAFQARYPASMLLPGVLAVVASLDAGP